jgi:hypothetical protein
VSKSRALGCLLVAFSVVLILSTAQSLSARPAEGIGAIDVTATPRAFRGPCPARLHFSARIEVDHYPMTFNYQWERSDGALGPKRIAKVPSPHTRTITLVDTWQVGRKGDHMDVWQKVRIRSGNTDITSRQATVTLDCK